MRTILNFKMLKVVVAAIAMLFFVITVNGANSTFTNGGVDNNWSTPGNWNAGAGPVPPAGNNIRINGTCVFDNAAANLVYGTLNVGQAVVGSLSWPIGGTNTLQVGNISSTIAGSSIDMTNGGTLQTTGTWTTANQTFTSGTGTIIFRPGVALAMPAAITTYNNLTINPSAAVAATLGVATTVNGNLLISAGTLNTSAANNWALTVKGNFTNNSTFTGNTSTITLNGAALQTISGTGAITFSTLIANNAVGVTLGKAITTTNTTVKSGTIFDAATFALTASGTFTMEATSTFKQGGAITAVPGATQSLDAASTYIYNGTQAGIAAGTWPTYGNLTFQPTPGGNGTFAGNLNVAGNMIINLGDASEIRFATGGAGRTHSITKNLTIQGGTVVGNNGTAATSVTVGGNLLISAGTFTGVNTTGAVDINVAGNFTNNSTWQHGAGSGIVTTNFNGTLAQAIGGTTSPTTFEVLTISNTAAAVTAGINITTTTLNNISGGTLDMVGYTLSGTTLNNTGSTIKFNGASNGLAIGTGTIEYYGATQNVTSGTYATLNITAAGTKTAGGAITATTLDNGGASNNAAILDMAGNTLTATTIDNAGATIMFSGANGLAIPTGTVEYYGAGQAITVGTYNNLTLSGSGTKTGAITTVNGNLSISGSAAYTTEAALTVGGNISIGGTAFFTIGVGKALTATGSTTNAGSFTIDADATGMGSFIDNGTVIGSVNVKRWVSDNGGSRWEYVSAPVASLSSSSFTSAGHYLWKADEPTNAWVNLSTPETMNPMQGYARLYKSIDGDANTAVSVSGTLFTGSQSITTTYTTGIGNGYNLVGNPYPSSIDWDLVSHAGIDGAIYYRTNGTYIEYVGGLPAGDNIIPPMQAFWIKVTTTGTSPSLSFDNSYRVHGTKNIYKTNTGDNTLELTVANDDNGLTDYSYIRFMADATDGFDSQYDAYKMFAADAAYPQIYTNNGVDDISINSLSDLVGERTVPLGFKTTLSGNYTLTADLVSSFTDLGNTVYLEDLQTETYQDLSANNTYQFTSNGESGFGRFILHFNPSITSVPSVTEGETSVYSVNNDIYVNTPKTASIEVYDVLGNLIMNKQSEKGLNKLQLNVETGVYIVKVQTGTQIITQKVMISK